MSEVEPYEFRAPLSIAIDFKSPNAYLALQPTFELIDSLGLEVEWLPFDAPALKPYAQAGPDAPRGARHRWVRAQYWARDIERYAERQGLTIKDVFLNPDTSLAGIGLLWLKKQEPDAIRPYLRDCFAGLWSGTLDLENEDALAAVIQAAHGGPGFAEFAKAEGRREWDSLRARLVAAGIFDVPTYVIGNELYLGRQHLPMVRKLLERRGE